jgi:ABC-type transporter Mla MlaB component
MWRIHKISDGDSVVLNISGRLASEELAELERAVSSEQTARRRVELDLRDVKLVDQHVVTFLACCKANGTQLRNCPPYIREWIARETATPRPQD